MRYISHEDFGRLLHDLERDYQVYVACRKNIHRYYRPYAGLTDDVVIGEVRAFEPLKAFFFRARQKVAEGFSPDVVHGEDRPVCIVGAKACDLKAFAILDHVFRDHDYADPYYVRAREANLIISADCTYAIDTCFCLALNVDPYPREAFDINLSPLDDGFLVETGSQKGTAIVAGRAALFADAGEQRTRDRNETRRHVIQAVQKNIEQNRVPHQDALEGAVARNYEAEIWADEAQTCVECGACNTICPTCHCFLLYDQKGKAHIARFRIWDACLLKDFARVAGGANPQPKLWMRLRNRFEKKFDFFPKVAGMYACTGCGRCISACPAKIDIRRILKRLVNHA